MGVNGEFATGMRIRKAYSVILGSEEFVRETKEKFIRESGVTQTSQRLSVRLREDENLRKAVKVIEKKIFVKCVGLTPLFPG